MGSKSKTTRDNLIKSTSLGRYRCSLTVLWARDYNFEKQALEDYSFGAWKGTPSQVMVSLKTQKVFDKSSWFLFYLKDHSLKY